MTINEALTSAVDAFKKADIKSAQLDAEILIAHTILADRSHIIAHPEQGLTDEQAKTIVRYIRERSKRKPIAYITGHKEFYGFDFLVNKHTLIPRPETEALVEEVIIYCTENPRATSIIELGVGSGCVIVSILKSVPRLAHAVGVDKAKRTLDMARRNADRLGVQNRIDFVCSDMWKYVPSDRLFDCVVSNPPYLSTAECAEAQRQYPEIAFEPQNALHGGTDGYFFFESLFKGTKSHLRPQGKIFLEIGTHQKDGILTLAKKYLPQADLEFRYDDCGLPRIAIIKT